MSESALKKLRREAKVKKYGKKTEVTRRKQVEKERVEQVRLIGTIYIEFLASWEPTKEEIKIFEEKKKSKELEEEFKAVINFLKRTMISIATTKLRVIIILDSKEELEIISQLVVKEQTPLAP